MPIRTLVHVKSTHNSNDSSDNYCAAFADSRILWIPCLAMDLVRYKKSSSIGLVEDKLHDLGSPWLVHLHPWTPTLMYGGFTSSSSRKVLSSFHRVAELRVYGVAIPIATIPFRFYLLYHVFFASSSLHIPKSTPMDSEHSYWKDPPEQRHRLRILEQSDISTKTGSRRD